ncbi:HIT-like protein [Pleomassaria siparia CBS 279.74]|uniref:Bis(5'-adenosyl)-triphosphatase n=1 Tax=Pleomassaria siparia CBS 279.74 TaxID=1314801 RepID=A0A6G1KNX7_9PLEO|nr:HIT-like protein [Pleomassaria siparia CBS 279.74]
MSPLAKDAVIKFGSFVVTNQVFHTTPLSYALVNLKPLLPGHVLVSPRRIVPRLHDLSPAEVQDLFLTVQRVSRMVERVFAATSLNIGIQDGVDAGQSVPHVHAHIIPRKIDDLKDRGGNDAIYGMLEGEEGNVGGHLKERDGGGQDRQDPQAPQGLHKEEHRAKFPAVVADDERKPRSEQVMIEEAEWLAGEMAKEDM